MSRRDALERRLADEAGPAGAAHPDLRAPMPGAVVAVLLDRTDLPVLVVAAAGFSTCLVWRLMALVRGWSAPLPRGPANV